MRAAAESADSSFVCTDCGVGLADGAAVVDGVLSAEAAGLDLELLVDDDDDPPPKRNPVEDFPPGSARTREVGRFTKPF